MKRDVLCLISQTDIVENKTIILYQGQGEIINNQLMYIEQFAPYAKTEIKVTEHSIHIHRKGEAETNVNLFHKKKGDATVLSELGELLFDATLKHSEITKNAWVFEYQILSGNEIILHTSIQCKFLEN